MRLAGVDTSGVIWNAAGRMGTYFVEFGAPPRGTQVTYDRAHSVIVSFGEQGAWLWDGIKWQQELARSTHIVDRLGAGDALAAGVIHGWLDGDLSAGLRYGMTLAGLALSQFGDMLITNRSELLALTQGSSTLTR